ncbi:MAG: methyltransferase domain-containing protein [Alphaproteobacteria bacterium]|nr:methyltransferase domain-containing protein [Alphaproteobacteria bacterium]
MAFPITPLIQVAERDAVLKGRAEVCLTALRALTLAEFGRLMFALPDARLPGLSRLLPRMASVEVQLDWTGSSGDGLLEQTLGFVGQAADAYRAATGRSLAGARILDFGCGYGRMLRLMTYYADPERIFGCDPWDRSIAICREDGVLAQLAVSDYLPAALPFQGRFDFIYAYSVFTHLSRRATHACLDTLSGYLAPGGVLIITTRPEGYWAGDAGTRAKGLDGVLTEEYRKTGFAFRPHRREPVDGDITYGEATMSLDYIRDNFPAYRIAGSMPSAADPLQIVVVLQPAEAAVVPAAVPPAKPGLMGRLASRLRGDR